MLNKAFSVTFRSYAVILVILFIIVGANQAYAQDTEEFEYPQVFHVSKLLPTDVVVGPDYRIQNLVYNDGIINRFDINSDYGFLSVEGSELLKVRLKEIKAIRQMEELKRTKVYGDALKKAVTGPLRLAKGLVTQPIDTLSGIGSGIGKWFGQIGHTIYGSPSEGEEGTLKVIFGFNGVKRNFAYQFGVDPYSTNPLLQKYLNEITWTAFAGNLTVRAAFMAIPGVAGTVVSGTSFSKGMRVLARDMTTAELKKYNREKLKTMGADEEVSDTFLDHPKWSPTATTKLVGALDQMKGVRNREAMVAAATLVQSEAIVYFRQRQTEMMAAYHLKVSPVDRMIRLGEIAGLQKKDGTLVVVVPVDHVAWVKGVKNRVTRTSRKVAENVSNVTAKELWLGGTVTPFARQKLEAQGWVVKENMSQKLTLD